MSRHSKRLRLQFRYSSAHGADLDLWERAKARVSGVYNGLIGDLSHGQESPDWWVSSIASRNPFVSRLFFRLCVYDYVEALARTSAQVNGLDIVVDSHALSSMLKAMLESTGVSDFSISVRIPFEDRKSFRIFKVVFAHLARFIILRGQRAEKAKIESMTLLDLFILPGWRSGISRYYGRLLQLLPPEARNKVQFVPEFLSSSPLEVFRQKRAIKLGSLSTVYKQTYLTFGDYVYALLHIKRASRLSFRDVSFEGHSITALVQEELNAGTGYDSSVRGLLNYRFFYRLQRSGEAPKKIIGWFENQALDKGWNLGANTFCPSAENVGYQAFPDMAGYFCMFPTDSEFEHGVLPKQLAVSGRGWIKSRTQLCSGIPVSVAPAFRFEHVWSTKSNKRGGSLIVLVTLPIDTVAAMQILRVVKDYLHDKSAVAPQFRIKLHPAGRLNSEDLSHAFAEVRHKILIENDGFDVAIRSANMLFSTMSSTCLESIACGVPVAVYVGDGREWQAIPDDVPKRFSHIVRHAADLRDAVEGSTDLTGDEEQIALVRTQYFERPTEEGAIQLVG